MNRRNVMDTSIKAKKEISISLFSYLISEMIQYSFSKQKENKNLDIQNELSNYGYPIGEKLLEISTLRDKGFKKETKIESILHFIHNNLWKMLFNKQADGIQRSTENKYEYRILEKNPITNKYIPTFKNFNASSFISGIIEGFLNSAGFRCKVGVYYSDKDKNTYYIINFDEDIVDKDDKNKIV